MTISDLQQKALEISNKYDELNKQKRGITWSRADFMQGFVGDVGDLAKLVMAKEGVRHIDDVDAKLAHELADCLWSVLVLADKYDVDIESSFTKTMDELSLRIDKDLAA